MWQLWVDTKKPDAKMIPVAYSELRHRISVDAFDGGQTSRWLADLEAQQLAIWQSLRDPESGHTIHAVSDRRIPPDEMQLFFRLMRWMSQTQPLTLYFWDYPWTRCLPENEIPGRNHVNGGWAVPGIPEIHVYRREEAHKVMLHEAIHALSLDIENKVALQTARLEFERELGRQLWPHFNEAVTELMAELLWSTAQSKSLLSARAAWNAQKQCSAGQAGIIWSRTRSLKTAEDTNIFSYYILKWVLMQHDVEVFLAPERSVTNWLKWWKEQLPTLERLSATATAGTVPLGMTCATIRC